MTQPAEKSVDNRVYEWTIRCWDRHVWFDAFFVAVARWTPMVMLCVIVLASTGFASSSDVLLHRMVPAATSITAAIVVRMVNEPLTRIANRPRPFQESLVQPLLEHDEGGSFPSNHAAGALALAFGFLGVSPYFYILLTLAVLLCIARVYTGLHYVTDVMAGAVNGIIVSVLVGLLIHGVY